MTNKLIYIAGPIANGGVATPREMWQNVQNGLDIYMQLVEKGYSPICPHFSYFPWLSWPRDIPWQTWLDMDFEYVRDCDYFFYMSPAKFGPSKGALREYEYAQKLNKVIYDDIDTVPTLERGNHEAS